VIDSSGGRAANVRASLAAFLSFVFPGLGQAYNGQTQLAWLLALPALLVVALLIGTVTLLGSGLLARLLDIRFLIGLLILDVALLAWRLVAIAQAHRRREAWGLRRWTTSVTGVLLLMTLAMHVIPAWYAVKAIDTLGSVAREGGGHAPPVGERGTPLPEPSDQPAVVDGERVNVLLVGVDEGPGRASYLTDTMLVVGLDPDSGRTAMVSIPRDLYGVPLPDGRRFDAKLNSLLAYASQRPDEFPLGGVGTLKEAIAGLLGIDIHYYAQVNLLGFRDAIDAIGGVDVSVERAIADPRYADSITGQRGFYLDAGEYHMDGTLALAYARSRMGAGDSDFTRAARQQQLLTAIRAKLTAGNLLVGLPALLDAAKANVATDVPSDRMAALAGAVAEADLDRLRQVVLQPPRHMAIDPNSAAGYILVPDLDAIRAVGRRLLADPNASVGTEIP
jgi:LCP family protein required for cell wall assembly